MLVIDFYMGLAITLALGCVFPEIFLIVVFFRRFIKNNRPQSILLLLLALFFILIGDSFGHLGMFVPKKAINIFIFLSETSFIATLLSAIFFLFFYELFNSNAIFGVKQLIISVSGTFVLTSFFFHNQIVVYNPVMDVHILIIDDLTSNLNKVFPVFVGVTVIGTVYRNHSLAWKKQQRQLLYIGIGAFTGYLTPFIFIELLQNTIVGSVGLD